MHERVKSLVCLNGTTIEDALVGSGMTLNTWNTLVRNGRFPRAEKLSAFSRNLNSISEYILFGKEGEEYVLEWAGSHGVKWRPPPRIKSLLDVASELEDNDLKMVEAIVKTYLDQRDTKPNAAANQ